MDTSKSDRKSGEKHHTEHPKDEKQRTQVETPTDEAMTPEEEMYAPTGTPPGDETYRPNEERYSRGETRSGDEGYVGTTPPYRPDAGRALGDAGHTVRTGIAGSLRGVDEIESDIVWYAIPYPIR
jgi:hypothetical protein